MFGCAARGVEGWLVTGWLSWRVHAGWLVAGLLDQAVGSYACWLITWHLVGDWAAGPGC